MRHTSGRSDLGLADLLELFHSPSGLTRKDVLSLLNYSAPALELDKPEEALHGERNEAPLVNQTSKAENKPIIGGFRPFYWQILEHKHENLSEAYVGHEKRVPALDSSEILDEESETPCLTPQRLQPHTLLNEATTAVSCPVNLKQQQVKQWLDTLAKAEVPRAAVPQTELEESGEIWLVTDYHENLMPLWGEFYQLNHLLLCHFGESRTRLVPVLHGDPLTLNTEALPWPSTHTRILVFSDLGYYSNPAIQFAWHKLLLQWQGAGAAYCVFLPNSKAPRLFPQYEPHVFSWESADDKNLVPVADELLAALSIVQWCSAELLTVWRRMLGGRIEDEIEVWRHPKVWSQPDGCGLQGRYVGEYRDRFRRFDERLRLKLQSVINNYREDVASRVKKEELIVHDALALPVNPIALKQARDEFLDWRSRPYLFDHILEYLYRFSDRQDASVWRKNPDIEALCLQGRKTLYKQASTVPLGPGMSGVSKLKDSALTNVYTLTPCRQSLKLNENADSNGQVIAELHTSKDEVQYQHCLHDGVIVQQGLWKSEALPDWQVERKHTLVLKTPEQTLKLRQSERPAFATEIEQTPNGLFCTLANGRRLRWCYPGEAFNGFLHPLHAPEGTVKATWVDETQWYTFQHSKHLPYLPEGAMLGKDDYGAYADIHLNLGLLKRMFKGQFTLRMRWIPPGEFYMGSPADEPERNEGEVSHRVLITRGYWLAETACTQQLWQAVMKKNPSRFQGEDFPVDSVSWDDVQDFCRRLNKHDPNFLARLPSEAEWEYACRASTSTPFWWGERMSTAQANYDGRRPYHDGEKGEFRRTTLRAKSFDANPWGLYQVHGNAWEWCQDWHGDYEQKPWTLDPGGVGRGTGRVLRGGGWFLIGRRLRAACRDADLPDWVSDFQGFRLAAGPRPGGAEEPETDAGGEWASEDNAPTAVAGEVGIGGKQGGAV